MIEVFLALLDDVHNNGKGRYTGLKPTSNKNNYLLQIRTGPSIKIKCAKLSLPYIYSYLL